MTTSVIDFDTRVAITVHGAYLSAAGVLLTDPIVHISEVTAYTAAAMTSATNREVSTTISTRRLVSTERKVFTAHPIFDETFRLVLPHSRDKSVTAHDNTAVVNRYLVVEVEGIDGEFLGQAVCPFALTAPSRGSSKRLMLLPRNAGNRTDALFKADAARLEAMALDDFGNISVSYDVTLAPHGGVLLGASPSQQAPMPLPIGLVVKATWLTNASSASALGNKFSTFVEFGTDNRAAVEPNKAAYITLHQAPSIAIFSCVSQKGSHGQPQIARITVPMQPAIPAFIDRDVSWCYPVHSTEGMDWGVIMITMRLLQKPMTEFELGALSAQGIAAAGASVWQSPLPDCPKNAVGLPVKWEGDSHIAMAKGRRWRRDVVMSAKAMPEHVRHIFEATLRRVEIDSGVTELIASFFNKPFETVSPAEMRELLIAMSFACLPLSEALKFSFAVMRSKVPNALTESDIVFILEHCLAPYTLDMPRTEIERRVHDLFSMASEPYISYDQYVEYFVKNDVLWYECGVMVEHGSEIRAQSSHGGGRQPSYGSSAAAASVNTSTGGNNNATGALDASSGSVWRTFTVRVMKTGRAFNVTAHINDIVADVMTMVEPSSTIAAYRQAWVYEGLPIDARRSIGSVLPVTPTGDVSIIERDESVLLVLVHREKNKRWEHRFPLSDKVLKLRAHVQQKTMIPLSRCVMRYAGNVMWDRHLLEHYKLSDGAIIEISTQ